MKKVIMLLSVLLVLSLGIGHAQAQVDVEVLCPNSVKANSPLSITVKFYNYDCSPASVKRLFKGIVGNSGGTLGGAGIWGPFSHTFATAITVPAATCSYPYAPGVSTITLPIISSTPNTLTGTMAMVIVSTVTTPGGQSDSGDTCLVNVVP